MSLIPSENVAKQARERADAAGTNPEDQSLDPDFPYQVIQFDPTAFGTVADQASAN